MDNTKVIKVSTFSSTTGLALIFITLKLLGKITWSWWWVLSPWWIPPVLFVLGFIIYASFIWKHHD